MSNYNITKKPALGGIKHEFNDVFVAEVTDHSLVMMAMPQKKIDEIAKELNDNQELSIPSMGKSSKSKDNLITLWRLQKNQVMAYFPYENHDAESYISKKLSTKAYYTDQSDAFSMINISGKNAYLALERICPIDLDTNVFVVGSVARTIMEHIGTIIYKNDTDSFILLVMRSFSKSIMHAIEVSIKNTQ
jgi:sarcosine oxidase subunit gamma